MDELTVAAALTLISIFLASIFFFIFKNSKSPKLPPGPRGLPFVGYLPFLQPNLHHQFTKLAKKYGTIYKLYLGSKLYIVISSPSLIKEVVRDHDSIFANRDPPVSALALTQGLDIVWPPYGPYWRDMRKLFVREMLSNRNMEASYLLRKEEVRKVVKNVMDTRIGKRIDIGELAFLTELNVILRLLWGGTMDEEKQDRVGSDFRGKISKIVDLLGKPNLSDFFPGLARFDVQGIVKEMRNVMPGVEGILDSVIDERMKMIAATDGENGERRDDFLEVLLELKGQDVADRPFGDTEIKAILMDSVVGGTDTTATTVEWVMAELLQNPSVMQKVQQELSHVVGMNSIVEESYTFKLHYLDAVVKETFRLHPLLPLIVPRCPSQSCTVGGYTIPKGSRVFMNVWSVHNDPEIWENPLDFKPERFLNDHNGKFDYTGNNFQYLPFGSGRRVCPGLALGERMVMYLLATLVHSFDWRMPDGEGLDLSEKFGIVMKKHTPLFAVPSQRLPDLNLYA